MYNSTSYPLQCKTELSTHLAEYKKIDKPPLHYYQYLIKEFFTKHPEQRGLLICHDMGYGKTRIAVSIAEYFAENDPQRQIVILMSKSLEQNFKNNVEQYAKEMHQVPQLDKYNFVSLNASNMYKQIERVAQDEEERIYEKRYGDFMDDLKRISSLENSLLVIDEAHRLFNSISNGSKNAIQLYDLIMDTKNLRLIFLTGTPIVNSPFELVPCFNMVRGLIRETRDEYTTLFSESYKEFCEFFIDNDKMKNRDKFINRIYGLSSYYGSIYQPGDRADFPTELPIIVEYVPMSQEQFAAYNSARHSEMEESTSKFSSQNARFSSSKGAQSTYRVKSRQISNFVIPEYALGEKQKFKSRIKYVDKIKEEDLYDLSRTSPKMKRILENIAKHSGQIGVVYSQFVSGEGLAIFARVLDAHGYKHFTVTKNSDSSNILGGDISQNFASNFINDIYGGIDLDLKKEKLKDSASIEIYKPKEAVQPAEDKQLTYAIISGDIDVEERQIIIDTYNSVDNINGKKIALLLISSAAAEGIDLKHGRHLHIMEPFWNMARINQVKTRLIRYKSHSDMPESERNVQTYIYLSDYPLKGSNVKKSKHLELTTDIDLYQNAFKEQRICDEFMSAIIDSSVDCAIHYTTLDQKTKQKIHCKQCAPTDKPLFHPDINKDMLMPDPCHAIKEEKITTNEIIANDGEKLRYNLSNRIVKLFRYDSKLDGWKLLERSDPRYGMLVSKILSNG